MSTHSTATRRHHLEVLEHLGRNFTTLTIEGGLYMGGLHFMAGATVLPALIERLGGSAKLISISPLMMIIGFTLPGMFSVRRLERLTRMKPLVTVMGVFQRLPYLIAGLALFFLDETHNNLLLIGVVLTPLVSGLFCGVTVAAWLELVAKVIPDNRRSSMSGVRNVIGAVIGVLAGWVIHYVLNRWPGNQGFGILHLLAFICMAGSICVLFFGVRETQLPPKRAPDNATWLDFLFGIPRMLKNDRRLARYMLARTLCFAVYLILPFVWLMAKEALDLSNKHLGNFVISGVAGGILGNVIGAYIGDRFGGKQAFLAGLAGVLAGCGMFMQADTLMYFHAVFIMLGVSMAMLAIGSGTLAMAIAPIRKRISYMTVTNLATLSGALYTMVISLALHALFGETPYFRIVLAAAAALFTLASLVVLLGLEDPRKKKQELAL